MDIYWPVWVILYAVFGILTLAVANVRGALDGKSLGFAVLVFVLWWVLWGAAILALAWALLMALFDILMEIIKFLVWLVLGGNV